jgi:hypothetical protein
VASGFAAAQFGKALLYRQISKSNRRLCLPVEAQPQKEKMNRRKGGAFPHCAAAKPLYRAPPSGLSYTHPFSSAQVALRTPLLCVKDYWLLLLPTLFVRHVQSALLSIIQTFDKLKFVGQHETL